MFYNLLLYNLYGDFLEFCHNKVARCDHILPVQIPMLKLVHTDLTWQPVLHRCFKGIHEVFTSASRLCAKLG